MVQVQSMDRDRERAYLRLLYFAVTRIRNMASVGHAPVPWWNPFAIARRNRTLRHASDLADAFHNLAEFASDGWQGFDEERFWSDIESYFRRYPEERGTDYRGIFERRLRDPDSFW